MNDEMDEDGNYPIREGQRRIRTRGGKRDGSGRKRTYRKSIMIRLDPWTLNWLDQRRPVPRGHVVDELCRIADEAMTKKA